MSETSLPANRTIAVVGDVYRFLATGAETDGRYALWEAFVAPDAGPPPHIHTREVEAFYMLEGRVAIYVAGQRRELTAGQFAHVPIGTLHTFKNETAQPARMLILVAPAGLEQMFFEVGQAVDEGTQTAPLPSPEELARLVAAAPRYGVELRLPPESGRP